MDPTIRAKFDTAYMEFQRWTSGTFGTAEVQTEEESKLPASGAILFAYGAKYLATVHAEIRPHVKKYGFRHKA